MATTIIDPFTNLAAGQISLGDLLDISLVGIQPNQVDNFTIGFTSFDQLHVIGNLDNSKLDNPYINLLSNDNNGITTNVSQIQLGDTLELSVDNTVLRTFGSQEKDGLLHITDSTNSTSSLTGCMLLDGGLGIAKDVYCGGQMNAICFNARSDKRLKKEIKILENSLDIVDKIKCYTYKWKKSKISMSNNKLNFGVLAQQLEEIGLNNLVTQGLKYKSVNYIQLIPLLISSVQELKKEIVELKKQIN